MNSDDSTRYDDHDTVTDRRPDHDDHDSLPGEGTTAVDGTTNPDETDLGGTRDTTEAVIVPVIDPDLASDADTDASGSDTPEEAGAVQAGDSSAVSEETSTDDARPVGGVVTSETTQDVPAVSDAAASTSEPGGTSADSTSSPAGPPLAGVTEADWRELQGKFVDDPTAAVQEAGTKVEQALAELRGRVESGSTEDLRTAFRRYRDLFASLR